MKSKIALAVALLLLMAAPAFAGDCQTDIADLDAQIASSNAPEGAVKEAQYMRDEAAQACDAGDEETAASMIENARHALGN